MTSITYPSATVRVKGPITDTLSIYKIGFGPQGILPADVFNPTQPE